MWYKVKELSESGLNKSQIHRETGLDRGTIRRYLSMSESSFHSWISRPKNLPKKLSQYYQYVKSTLERQPYLSAAQIEDRLMEHFEDLPSVNSKTVYNFVQSIRQEHGIFKESDKAPRDFQNLREVPYGSEAQVDFGEMRLRTETSYRIKVYFFSMVLSRSRQKFVYFQLEPFTTASAVYAHELAFEYFQGIPKKIIYDQDSVFLHRENLGDLLLTEGFRSFCDSQPFKPVFCRKSDPQSKGKIENVIKYVKYNFLRGRMFKSISLLQKEVLAWLKRRGNGRKHSATHKIPAEEWIKEQKFLYPLTSPATLPNKTLSEYTVRKDNCITYKGNYYSLPGGTYRRPGAKVLIEVKGSILFIYTLKKEKIVQHLISNEKGQVIRREFHGRSKSVKKEETYKEVLQLLDHEHAEFYLKQIEQDRPRYYHDTLKVLRQNLQGEPKEIVNEAFLICLENQVFNAYEFGQVLRLCKKKAHILPETLPQTINTTSYSSVSYEGMEPEKSNIMHYETILK